MTEWHVSGPHMLNTWTCTKCNSNILFGKLAEDSFPNINLLVADSSMEIQHYI